MSNAQTKIATYADIEALPPNMVGEILFGSLITHPRPTPRHGAAAYAVGSLIGSPFQFGNGGPGGWIFIVEPELHFGPHVLVPDIAGWKIEHSTGRADKAWIETAPDWLCEVLSPSTERYDRHEKQRINGTYKVGHIWHVNPTTRLLEVYERQERGWLLSQSFQDQDQVTAPPFEAITFNLGLLWPFDQPLI